MRARVSLAILSFALLLAACSAKPRGSPVGGVSGSADREEGAVVRVTFREVALPGCRVEWRRADGPEGETVVSPGVTDSEGKIFSALPRGKFLLFAQWRADGDYARPILPGDRFAYFGGNPVHVSGGAAKSIFISLVEMAPPPPVSDAPAGSTGVFGHVSSDGTPVPDAVVTAYLRADGSFRDLGFASAPSGPDGSFAIGLPPGKYFLVVRKRASGEMVGPLRKGDYFGYYPANPVEVSNGRITPLVIPVTILKMRNAPFYSGDEAGALVEGRILGRDGKPGEGVYAALYDNPAMLGRPMFLSDVTGPDGRYRISVREPGKYYLGARTGYGGAPAPGGLYGRYEGNPDHSVSIREGERLTGMDIDVHEVR